MKIASIEIIRDARKGEFGILIHHEPTNGRPAIVQEAMKMLSRCIPRSDSVGEGRGKKWKPR